MSYELLKLSFHIPNMTKNDNNEFAFKSNLVNLKYNIMKSALKT